MSRRYTLAGCNNWQQRPIMSEARRNAIHGPLVSDLPPIRPIRELVGGAAVVALFCLVVLGAAVVLP